ncbi:MAG TPA: peptidylprolyl isomerase [Vicinamibacterales bacterium]|nr:peptidylprolyl isomerase [Vicinamibacterales bacterium]
MRHVVAVAAAVAVATASAWAGQGSTAKPAPAGQKPAGQKPAAAAPAQPKRSPGAGPLIVVETVKGTFQFETYPNEAPKSVEHVLALVKRNFYNGMRVHRQIPGFIMQFGDPFSRDMSKKDLWGTGGSFNIVGVGEPSPKRTHALGAVAMAYPGKDPRQADSQLYVTLAPVHRLDGNYTVIGQVIAGMDVVQKLAVPDVIRRVTVKE